MEKLLTGVAYHGNRILRHVEEDMLDIVNHNMNLVVHMFSHNDWDRHLGVMKDVVDISKKAGLEVWIDNWGLAGAPGDKSFYLEYHPDAHQIFNDGSVSPTRVCLNHPEYVQFTKDWLDAVKEFGGETIFWDEPSFAGKKTESGEVLFACCCQNCKRLCAKRYGHKMPAVMTKEVKDFRAWSLLHYFEQVTGYAASLGMKNVTCVMPHTIEESTELLKLPHLDNFGTDPYWGPRRHPERDVYDFVYQGTKNILDLTAKYGKESHLWIQAYDFPAGSEDDLIFATDAAYDAGARTIIDWSFRGGEPNSYKSDRCDMMWRVMGEAMGRIRARHLMPFALKS